VVNMLMREVLSHSLDTRTLRVTVLGASFRGNVSDTRNSPTHMVVSELKRLGVADVVVHDPMVTSDEYLAKLGVKLLNDLKLAMSGSGAVIVAADHSPYSTLTLKSLLEYSGKTPLIVIDAKGVLRAQPVEGVVYRRLGVGGSAYECP